jgi:site-specific recombinase XerD
VLWCAERGTSPAECGSADMKSFKAWLQADGAPEQMERMRARWYGREARIKYTNDWRGPAALAVQRCYLEAVRDARRAVKAAQRANKRSQARLVKLADRAVANCRGLCSMLLAVVASYERQPRAVSTVRYSNDTVALRITLVRNFFKMAMSRQGVYENPVLEIKVGKSKTSRRDRALSRYFSDEEVMEILARCNEEACHTSYDKALAARNKCMLALQAVEGLRVSEVSNLDVSDYNRSMGDFGALHIRSGKGGKSRMVPLTEKMQVVLERHLAYRNLLNPKCEAMFVSMNHGGRADGAKPGNRIDTRSIRYMFDRIQAELGIKRPGRTNHGLRHRFGTKAIRNGGNLYAVSAHMGHSQITTTQVYVEMAAFEDDNVSKLTDNVL